MRMRRRFYHRQGARLCGVVLLWVRLLSVGIRVRRWNVIVVFFAFRHRHVVIVFFIQRRRRLSSSTSGIARAARTGDAKAALLRSSALGWVGSSSLGWLCGGREFNLGGVGQTHPPRGRRRVENLDLRR